MKTIIVVLVALDIVLGAFAMETKLVPTLVASISGKHADVIRHALEKLANRQLDPKQYDVLLMESEEEWTVVFRPKEAPEGYRGSPPGVPGYEVILRKNDLTVERENFSR
ncbi:MAG: hypothetical protein WD609_15100, partial [Aquisalimonadaceae bacterium]